jgi:heat shock protein HslJ
MLFTFSPSKPAAGHLLACIALPLLWSLTACAVPPAPAASAPPLWGTTWQLEDLGGRGVLDRAQATLAFPEAGRVAGQGSCNRFFGSVTVDGSRIGFGQIGSTRMACVAAVNEQESRYL